MCCGRYRSPACTDPWWWSGKGWTVYELACFLSPFVVDVVLIVTMHRQALAVLLVLTVEVPQIPVLRRRWFPVVGHVGVHRQVVDVPVVMQ